MIQIMACRLVGANSYLDRFQLTDWNLENNVQSNLNQIFMQRNAFENV